MSKLILMVGLSGSGKSTIAKEIAEQENAVIVSSDLIREELSFYEDQSQNREVFNIFYDRIKDNLHKGNTVIADATNITVRTRKRIVDIGINENAYIIAYVIRKDYQSCIIDNRQRKHPVPENVLERQNRRFVLPTYEEGFNEIVINDYSRYEEKEL